MTTVFLFSESAKNNTDASINRKNKCWNWKKLYAVNFKALVELYHTIDPGIL